MKLYLLSALLLIPVAALAQSADGLTDEWAACVRSEAERYGSGVCHAPSEMLPAIYSQCYGHERTLMRFLTDKYRRSIAEGTIEGTKDAFNQELPAVILEAQMSHCK